MKAKSMKFGFVCLMVSVGAIPLSMAMHEGAKDYVVCAMADAFFGGVFVVCGLVGLSAIMVSCFTKE